LHKNASSMSAEHVKKRRPTGDQRRKAKAKAHAETAPKQVSEITSLNAACALAKAASQAVRDRYRVSGEAATADDLELIAAYTAAKAAVRQWHVANDTSAKAAGPAVQRAKEAVALAPSPSEHGTVAALSSAKEVGPAAACLPRKSKWVAKEIGPSPSVHGPARSKKRRLDTGKEGSYGGPDGVATMTAAALGVTSADRRAAKKAAKKAARAGARPIQSSRPRERGAPKRDKAGPQKGRPE